MLALRIYARWDAPQGFLQNFYFGKDCCHGFEVKYGKFIDKQNYKEF